MFKYIFLLFPILTFSSSIATLPSNRTKPLIYLDPGHGGASLGAVIKKPYLEEKKPCLATALLTKKLLERKGYKVCITRCKDFFIPLSKRVEMANIAKAGVFVCIHYNFCKNPEVNGIEVFYADQKNNRSISSKRLATSVLKKSIENTSAHSRGVKKGRFYVIKETNMPAVLIEAGFLSNAFERKNINKKEYLEKVAKGISEGIDFFCRES